MPLYMTVVRPVEWTKFNVVWTLQWEGFRSYQIIKFNVLIIEYNYNCFVTKYDYLIIKYYYSIIKY